MQAVASSDRSTGPNGPGRAPRMVMSAQQEEFTARVQTAQGLVRYVQHVWQHRDAVYPVGVSHLDGDVREHLCVSGGFFARGQSGCSSSDWPGRLG